MASRFTTQVLRSIRESLGRFLAILLIVALGCGFYAGLRMTGPDMRLLADVWYDGTNLYDIQVVSTLGFTQRQVDMLAETEGVSATMPSQSVDVMTTLNESQYVMRMHSLDTEAAQESESSSSMVLSDDGNYLNRLVLDSGSWPTGKGEAVLSADRVMNSTVHIGDIVKVEYGAIDLEDVLETREYRVVGLAHSSLYTNDAGMGASSLGSGKIQQYLYVDGSSFDDDYPYTEVYLQVEGASEYLASSDEYQACVDEVAHRISPDVLSNDRLKQLKDDAQAELDDAKAEYEDAKQEADEKLADALAQLEDGQAQIDDGQAKLDKAAKQIKSGQRQLDDAAAKLAQGEKDAEAGAAAWKEKRAELEGTIAQAEDGLKQAEEGKAEAQAKKDELEGALAQVEEGIAAIESAIADLQSQLQEAQDGVSQAQAGIDACAKGIAEIDKKLKDETLPEEERAALLAQKEQLEQTEAGLQEQLEAAEAGVAQLEAAIAGLEGEGSDLAELKSQKAQIDAGIAEIDAGLAEADATIAQIEDGIAQAKAGIEQGDAAIADAQAQIEAGKKELDANRAKLNRAKSQYNDGVVELDNARAELADGWAEYESKKADADRELADAADKIANAQDDIDALEPPEVYVLDRTKNVGVQSVQADSERIDNIASVFPFVFFLVAALVALTTMTRMVDEERQLIGTFKALGYSKRRITGKYLVYAGIASITGAALGILALGQVLPFIIQNAYGIIYNVPLMDGLLPYEPTLALLAAAMGVGITLLATWAAAARTLRETPAALMLPPAPAPGKRILLERVSLLWHRLSFSWKVTCRNLFRYKKRFWMTVIGLAGCTALLLTGFGLHNAIWDIIDKQYGPIIRYNVVVEMDDDAADEDVVAVEEDLRSVGKARAIARAQTVNLQVGTGALEDETRGVAAVIPRSPSDFKQLVDFRVRQTQEQIPFNDRSVVITEKLANLLGVGVGDEISLFEQDSIGNPTGQAHRVTITGVTENYVGDQLYLGKEAYRDALGGKSEWNAVFADTDTGMRDELNATLMDASGVQTVAFNDETIDTYRTMLKSVNIIVVVLVVAAALLSFIVLYNLININITERRREIASLKVLGFTPREVNSYIFREVLLLTLIGAAIGLVLGISLEGFVVATAEVDYVMFGREIHAWSFGAAFALTIVFTCIVMFFMRAKLAAIDMVESLKSVE